MKEELIGMRSDLNRALSQKEMACDLLIIVERFEAKWAT